MFVVILPIPKSNAFAMESQKVVTSNLQKKKKISLTCQNYTCQSVRAHLVPVGLVRDFTATGFV